MSLYVPTAVPLMKNSYDELLHWWVSGKHQKEDDLNCLTCVKQVIYPSYIQSLENEKDYAEAILSILNLPRDEYKAMCERARTSVKEYDYPYLTEQMARVIEKL